MQYISASEGDTEDDLNIDDWSFVLHDSCLSGVNRSGRDLVISVFDSLIDRITGSVESLLRTLTTSREKNDVEDVDVDVDLIVNRMNLGVL